MAASGTLGPVALIPCLFFIFFFFFFVSFRSCCRDAIDENWVWLDTWANVMAVLDKRHVHSRVRRSICTPPFWRRGHCFAGRCDKERSRGSEEQGEMRVWREGLQMMRAMELTAPEEGMRAGRGGKVMTATVCQTAAQEWVWWPVICCWHEV